MTKLNLAFFSAKSPYEKTLRSEMDVFTCLFNQIYFFPHVEREVVDYTNHPEIITGNALYKHYTNAFLIRQLYYNFRLYLTIMIVTMFTGRNLFYYLRGLKTYSLYLIIGFAKASDIEERIKTHDLQNAIFYDYWFEDSTLALAILKKKGIIRHAYCRAHGFDLYDERWKQGRVPFREFKVKHLDKIFPVSDYGLEYFKKKIHPRYHHKLERHYLGVKPATHFPKRQQSKDAYLIVSAARTIALKQIHKIPDILSNIDLPIHWVHFGDGPALEKAQKAAQNLPSNVSCEFKGQRPNEEILDYYANNDVDLFISTSTSEGLPISMMEVLSYGIPVIAYDITAMSEIVIDKTGVLVSPTAGNEEYADAISHLLLNRQEKFPPAQIIEFFERRFDYKKNYSQFAKRIISLTYRNET